MHRQTDQVLITAISEISRGICSPASQYLIASLSRPIFHQDSVKLFSTNSQVDLFNRNCILNMSGPVMEYVAKDVGEEKFLDKIRVQRVLWLKDCPVMLLTNTCSLVNGSTGIVIELCDDVIHVLFQKENMTVGIKRTTFTSYDPKKSQLVRKDPVSTEIMFRHDCTQKPGNDYT